MIYVDKTTTILSLKYNIIHVQICVIKWKNSFNLNILKLKFIAVLMMVGGRVAAKWFHFAALFVCLFVRSWCWFLVLMRNVRAKCRCFGDCQSVCVIFRNKSCVLLYIVLFILHFQVRKKLKLIYIKMSLWSKRHLQSFCS